MNTKQQLAETRQQLILTRRQLERATHTPPYRTTDGHTLTDLHTETTDWLHQLADWDTTISAHTYGTIGRTGHTDPTGNAATRHRFRPDLSATWLLDRIQRTIDDSKTYVLGPDHQPRRPPNRTNRLNRRPHCTCGTGPHATSWTHCPWTGNPLT